MLVIDLKPCFDSSDPIDIARADLIANGGAFVGDLSAAAGDGVILELGGIIDAFWEELPEPDLVFDVALVAGGQTATFDPGDVRAAAMVSRIPCPQWLAARAGFCTLPRAPVAPAKIRLERRGRAGNGRRRRQARDSHGFVRLRTV